MQVVKDKPFFHDKEETDLSSDIEVIRQFFESTNRIEFEDIALVREIYDSREYLVTFDLFCKKVKIKNGLVISCNESK